MAALSASGRYVVQAPDDGDDFDAPVRRSLLGRGLPIVDAIAAPPYGDERDIFLDALVDRSPSTEIEPWDAFFVDGGLPIGDLVDAIAAPPHGEERDIFLDALVDRSPSTEIEPWAYHAFFVDGGLPIGGAIAAPPRRDERDDDELIREIQADFMEIAEGDEFFGKTEASLGMEVSEGNEAEAFGNSVLAAIISAEAAEGCDDDEFFRELVAAYLGMEVAEGDDDEFIRQIQADLMEAAEGETDFI